MTLEDQIRRYAQESRAMLLSQAGQQAAGGIAEWVGYSSSGKGLVKQNGRTRQVNVIGNVSLKKGQLVLLDANDTIQVMDLPPREQPRRTRGRQDFPVTPPFKKKRSILLPSPALPEEIGDYLLIYREPFTSTTEAFASEELYLGDNQTSSGGRVLWQTENQYNPRNSDMLMITAGIVDAGGFNPFGGDPPNASLTFGSSTASVGGGAGPVYDYPADYIANAETGQTLGFTMSLTSPEFGFAYFKATGRMFSYRNSPVYYVTGESGTYAIDLSSYTSGRIADSVLLHSYTSNPGEGSRYLYNIFVVASFTITVEEDPANVYDSTSSTLENYFYVCPLTYQYVFTKINLETGAIEGRSVETTLFDNQQTGSLSLDYLYSTRVQRNLGFGFSATAIPNSIFGLGWEDYLDPRPLFQNADPDDWIYQIKDAINDFPDTASSWGAVVSLLQKSYRNGKLNNYFSDDLPQYSSGVVSYPTASEKTIDLSSINSFSDIANAFNGASNLGSLDSVINTEEWIDHVTSVNNTVWRRYHGPNLQTSLPQFSLPDAVYEEPIDRTTAFALNLGQTEYIYLDS